ncbi:MAG TPA: dienelactone hydrolase family protein [Methyloceanibacter sp.]|jgi:dienelactone hydrolase|nr:dienelactone hydrolase family protein [Methyloceanibacter sp.]
MVLKLILFAAAFGLPAFAATAGESVDYVVDGERFEGYRSEAKANSKGLVVIVHDWDGATSYEKKRADMLAELGYDAFAVDLYGKGNRPAEIADKKKETGRLLADRERMRKLLLAGLEEARRGGDRPVVVIGYCFGGAAALELARSGQAKNVVGYATFHGGLATPEGQSYPSTTPPIFVAHGGADTSVTMDDVAALSRQLEQAGVQYEIQVYSGAPHGFTNFESERYQKRADERSWSAFTNSLTEVFGS